MDILLAAFVNSSQEVERNTHPPRWQKNPRPRSHQLLHLDYLIYYMSDKITLL